MQISSRKSSCGDLQSRLKVRKVLGVGNASCSSKISQILGQSDHFIHQLPTKLATWLFSITILFGCLTLMAFFCPSCLHIILPGHIESTIHLATTYAFLATILGLTLRSGDKICLQIVLFSLILFHTLSLFVGLWLVKTSDTKIKSILSVIIHLFCLLTNTHFYRSINRSSSSMYRPKKFGTYFNSLLSFPSSSSAIDSNTGHDSS